MNFDNIYAEYHPQIERFLISKVALKEDAEEIANEVFVKAHAKLHTFNPDLASMKTWLWRIAQNLMIDAYRKKTMFFDSIDEAGNEDNKDAFHLQIQDDTNPERIIESSEIGDAIIGAMVELPRTISDVAERHFIFEMTYEEIRVDLSIPLGTVKAHIFRAKECLRKRLVSFR